MGVWVQTTLEDFEAMAPSNESKIQEIDQANKEKMKSVHEVHISKMEKLFNEIFSKLFDEPYLRRP